MFKDQSADLTSLAAGRSGMEIASEDGEWGWSSVEGQHWPLCSMRRVRPVLKSQFPAFQ